MRKLILILILFTVIALPQTETDYFSLPMWKWGSAGLMQPRTDSTAILVTGNHGYGWTHTTFTAGSKFFWYPRKSAFRVGYVSGSQWNDGSIGAYSFGSGRNTTASGEGSTAMGYATTASGWGATAMGSATTASGGSSTAMGEVTVASGEYSFSSGHYTTAGTATFTTIFGAGYNSGQRAINNTARSFMVSYSHDTTKVGLHVIDTTLINSGSAILARGTHGAGWTEWGIGAGSRMMWYPRKSAFRAGYVAGVNWDNASIGNYSFGSGFNILASGAYSAAFNNSSATGEGAFSFGAGAASGVFSVGGGKWTTASGTNSFLFGLGWSSLLRATNATDNSFMVSYSYDASKVGLHVVDTSYVKMLGTVATDSLTTFYTTTKIDSATIISLPSGRAGWGEVMIGDNAQWASFRFTSAGVVTLILNSTNVGTTPFDANKLNIYDAGTNVAIQNYISAAQLNVAVKVHYFTP